MLATFFRPSFSADFNLLASKSSFEARWKWRKKNGWKGEKWILHVVKFKLPHLTTLLDLLKKSSIFLEDWRDDLRELKRGGEQFFSALKNVILVIASWEGQAKSKKHTMLSFLPSTSAVSICIETIWISIDSIRLNHFSRCWLRVPETRGWIIRVALLRGLFSSSMLLLQRLTITITCRNPIVSGPCDGSSHVHGIPPDGLSLKLRAANSLFSTQKNLGVNGQRYCFWLVDMLLYKFLWVLNVEFILLKPTYLKNFPDGYKI